MKKKIFIFIFALILLLSVIFATVIIESIGKYYDSTDTNITQESGFAHLNITDNDILQYFTFDIQDYINAWTPANNSNGLNFDGVNDMVFLDDMGTSNAGATISLWITQPLWNNGGEYIMDGRNSAGSGWWYLSDYVDGTHCADSAGNICFNARVGIHSGNFTSNTWYNVVVVFNSTFTKIYLNGELKDTGSGLTANLSNMKLGARYSNSSYINATYDEILIFDRIINETEILSLYNHEILNESGLISELLLDEGYGNIAYDSSGNDNNGVLINFDSFTFDYSSKNNDGYVVNTSSNGNKFFYNISNGYIGGAYSFEENFDALANYDASGITTNGTFIWVIDYLDLRVYKYWMNGTFTRDYFDTYNVYATQNYLDRGNNRGPYGIIQNNTFFWIVHYREAEVFKFWMNGTYTGSHFDTAASSCGNPRGITMNDTYFWIVDDNDDEVYIYWINGTYTTLHWDTAGSPGGNNNPFGIASNNTFFWITDDSDDRIYLYFQNGTYRSNFSISASGAADSKGATTDNTYLYITDPVDTRIYRYWINGTYNTYFSITLDTRPAKYVRAPIVLNNNTNFTFNVWIKPYNVSHNDKAEITNLYGDYDGWVWWNVGGSVSANFGNGTDQNFNSGSQTFPEGQWNMVTIMRNGTNFSVWKNGVYKGGKLIVSGTLRQNLNTYQRIGSYGVGYQYINWLGFNGSIDEFLIVNRTLTANELRQLYNYTFPKFYPSGEMFFDSINFSNNQTVNVSIPNCQQLNSSLLSVKFNNGDYQTLNSTCSYDNYIVTDSLTSANMTILLTASNNFYSSIVAGDINLESYDKDPPPETTLIEPENYYNTTNSTILFNASVIDTWSQGIMNVSLYIDGSLNQTTVPDLISNDTGFKSPSAEGAYQNYWASGYKVYSSDNQYAFVDNPGDANDFYNFNFNIPNSATITGIEVQVEASALDGDALNFSLSWDNGDNYTSPLLTPGIALTDTNYTLGNSTWTWGRAWTPSEFSNENFMIKGVYEYIDWGRIYVDHIQVKVYYTRPGDGGYFNFTKTLLEGGHNWSVLTYNANSAYNQSETRYLTIDYSSPTISFESPTPDNGSTVTSSSQVITVNISDLSNVSSWLDFNNDLLGYWSMDYYNETGVFDNSSHSSFMSYAGTDFGTSNIVTGQRGNGISLDGTDDRLSVSNYLSNEFYQNGLSVSYWVYMNPNANKMTLGNQNNCQSTNVGENYGWHFKVYGYNRIIFETCRGAQYSYNQAYYTFSSNYTWYHVVGVHDTINSRILIYVNGALQANNSLSSASQLNSTYPFYIGRDAAGGYFNGTIDEVIIVNRTLTSDEVLALYDSKNNKLNTTLTNFKSGTNTYEVCAIDQWGYYNCSVQNFKTSTNYSEDIFNGIDVYSNQNRNNSFFKNLNIEILEDNFVIRFIVGIRKIFEDFSINNIINKLFGTNRTVTNEISVCDYSFDKDGLVSWWRLDQDNVNQIDSFGISNATVLNETSYTESGRISGAYSFNGVNQSIKINSSTVWSNTFGTGSPSNGKNFTIMFYMKTDGLKNGVILGNQWGNDVAIVQNSAGYVLFSLDDTRDDSTSAKTSVPLNTNEWYHITVVYANNSFNSASWLYVNGVLNDTATNFDGNGFDSFSSFYLGWQSRADTQANYNYYNGTIDEVMIFNKTLTEDEIQTIYEHNVRECTVTRQTSAFKNFFDFFNIKMFEERAYWIPNLTINASKLDVGSYSSPSVFQVGETWHMMTGEGSVNLYFATFSWNGSQWLPNSSMNASLAKSYGLTSPEVFYKDESLYLIVGLGDGVFAGYYYNGTNWVSNTTIVSGLSDIGTYAKPSVFQIDKAWHLIAGAYDGNFYGFSLAENGTTWLKNLTLSSSLSDVGDFATPSIFYIDNSLYLVSGSKTGNIYSYTWTGFSWVPDFEINASLETLDAVTGWTTPEVFYKDDSLYLLSGSSGGTFYGFTYKTSDKIFQSIFKRENNELVLFENFVLILKDFFRISNQYIIENNLVLRLIKIFKISNQEIEVCDYPFNTSGLIHWWKLDDVGDTQIDSFGNLTLNVFNGTTYDTSGKHSGSFMFDGVNDYFQGNETTRLSADEGTIFLWVYFNESDEDQTIIIFGNESANGISSTYDSLFIRRKADDNKIYAGWVTGGEWDIAVSNNAISAGEWHNIILTWTLVGNDVNLNIDGADQTLGDVLTVDNKNKWINSFRVGSSMEDSTTINSLNGSIDEIIIFNRSLSASEVSDMYNMKSNQRECITTRQNSVFRNFFDEIDISEFITDLLSIFKTSNQEIEVCDYPFNTTSLLNWWTMDYYDSSYVYDNGTVNANLTYRNASSSSDFIDGKFGKSITFNSVNKTLTIPSSFRDYPNASYSFWIYNNVTSTKRLCLFGSGYFQINTAGGISHGWHNGTGYYYTQYSSGVAKEWEHFLVVDLKNGTYTNVTVYRNGELSFTQLMPGAKGSNTRGYIGGSDDFWSSSFNGSIDEVMVFNTTMTIDDAKALYNMQSNQRECIVDTTSYFNKLFYNAINIDTIVNRLLFKTTRIYQVININDITNRLLFKTTRIYQVININDIMNRIFLKNVNNYDFASFNDIIKRIFIRNVNSNQEITFFNIVNRLFVLETNVNQDFTIFEESNRILFKTITTNQNISIDSYVSRLLFKGISLNQIIDVNSLVTRVRIVVRESNVSFGIMSYVNKQIAFIKNIIDPITFFIDGFTDYDDGSSSPTNTGGSSTSGNINTSGNATIIDGDKRPIINTRDLIYILIAIFVLIVALIMYIVYRIKRDKRKRRT